jgi:hypothetical protein
VVASTAKKESAIMKKKTFPPYGKNFLKLRNRGKMPNNLTMVVFNWNLARAYPRIVLTKETLPKDTEFNYLAGLKVQIVFSEKEADRVDGFAQEILKVKPAFLSTFALHLLDIGATNILKPLEEL